MNNAVIGGLPDVAAAADAAQATHAVGYPDSRVSHPSGNV